MSEFYTAFETDNNENNQMLNHTLLDTIVDRIIERANIYFQSYDFDYGSILSTIVVPHVLLNDSDKLVPLILQESDRKNIDTAYFKFRLRVKNNFYNAQQVDELANLFFSVTLAGDILVERLKMKELAVHIINKSHAGIKKSLLEDHKRFYRPFFEDNLEKLFDVQKLNKLLDELIEFVLRDVEIIKDPHYKHMDYSVYVYRFVLSRLAKDESLMKLIIENSGNYVLLLNKHFVRGKFNTNLLTYDITNEMVTIALLERLNQAELTKFIITSSS